MKIIRIFLLTLIGLSLLTLIGLAMQTGQEFISFGADLSKDQRNQMYDNFRPQSRPQMIEVTNGEEHEYLSKYVPDRQIGSRAISSVYLQTLEPNSGIRVESNNITWVTSGMYANAAATAGVKDVLIKADSPYPVSGTAALTGIIKTFEQAQGASISSARKDAAYQELITTGELGEKVGKENAEYLIRDVKKEIVEKRVNDPEEIRIIIENKAEQYNIKLTETQIDQIQQLMEKINSLDLNVQEINNQLQNLNTKVKGIQDEGKKATGILAQILNLLQQLFNLIAKIFS